MRPNKLILVHTTVTVTRQSPKSPTGDRPPHHRIAVALLGAALLFAATEVGRFPWDAFVCALGRSVGDAAVQLVAERVVAWVVALLFV